MRFVRSHIKLLLLAILALAGGAGLQGCGLWTDFTTYFNTYYNASELFDDVREPYEEELKKDPFAIEDPVMPKEVMSNANKVIEKCSVILQYHSESSFVAEALMMIGKSFYYQQKYLGALRKFQELLAKEPESDLIPEAELWIAKSELRLGNSVSGLDMLESIIDRARENEREELLVEAYLERIRFNKREENIPEAIRFANELIDIADDDELAALVTFEIGMLEYESGNFQQAADAFKLVEEYSPDFDTEYIARLNYGKVLRSLDQLEESREQLEDLYDEGKFIDNDQQILLELGITLRQLGLQEEAYERWVKADTMKTRSEFKGDVQYELGLMFQEDLGRYDSAMVYFKKAQRTPNTEDYIEPIEYKFQVFNEYGQIITAYMGAAEELFYLRNRDQFEADSVAYDLLKNEVVVDLEREYGFDDYEEEEVSVDEIVDSLNTMIDSLKSVPEDKIKRKDSLMLSWDSFELKEEAEKIEEKKLREIERRRESTSLGDSIIARIGYPPKQPLQAEDQLVNLVTDNAMKLGNLFVTELNVPDSAYYYYNLVLQNKPEHELKTDVIFFIGSYFATVGDSARADSMYTYLLENYRGESIANAAAARLGIPLEESQNDPIYDLYRVGEDMFVEAEYDSSLRIFYDIAESYPESHYAAQSLFAAGYTLENELDLKDSAAAIYDTLAVRYPKSEFTKRIEPRLNKYKEEVLGLTDSLAVEEDGVSELVDVAALDDAAGDEDGNEIVDEKDPEVIKERLRKELNLRRPRRR